MSDTPRTDALIASLKIGFQNVATESEIKLARLCGELERELERELAAALKAKEHRVYKACPKHQDRLWLNYQETIAIPLPLVEVCPHCEQEAMKK